jgi:hypothetical protein
MALGEHIRCRLRSDGPIASSVEQRRIVARTVLEIGRPFDLLSFGLSDTHLHMETGRESGGAEYARRVEGALTKKLGFKLGFERVRVDPVADIWHLYRLFIYVLSQIKRHGVSHLDPLLEGTNLPDLLGLRTTGRYTAENVRRILPRIQRGQLLELLDLKTLAPADGPIEEIPLSAAAAVCRADLKGRREETISARRAALEIMGGRLDLQARAELLGVDPSTVCRQRLIPPEEAMVEMIRLQLGLRKEKWRQTVDGTSGERAARVTQAVRRAS